MIVWLLMSAWLVQASPSTQPAMRMLERGTQSYIDLPKQVVARTQAEMDAFWKQHAPNRAQPKVDFGTEMVVGVFLGSRNTAAYSVEIMSVGEQKTAQQAALVVRFHETAPPPAAVVAQVITTPYYLVAVPKYAGDVRFEKIP